MASQEDKTEERVALEEQAKALGVKSIHLYKRDESLEGAIAKKQAETEEVDEGQEVVSSGMEDEIKVEIEKSKKRKKAPSMSVANISNDDRTDLVTRMEREDPDCKYIFQSGNATDRELLAKGLERTGLSVKNDVLCRTMRDSYDGYISDKNQAQHESMQRIDPTSDGIVGSHEARAKKPPK